MPIWISIIFGVLQGVISIFYKKPDPEKAILQNASEVKDAQIKTVADRATTHADASLSAGSF